jgi:hypothetical protein
MQYRYNKDSQALHCVHLVCTDKIHTAHTKEKLEFSKCNWVRWWSQGCSCKGLVLKTEAESSSVIVGVIYLYKVHGITYRVTKTNKTNSVALSPRAKYTDWSTATCQRNLVSTFVDRGVSRGQRGGSLTVVNLSFLDRSLYFSFK